MSLIPTYELYGEDRSGGIPDVLHCESIALRSRAHAGRIGLHRHQDLFQIFCARAGRVTVEIENRSFSLSGGHMVLLPSLCVHGFRISPDTGGWVLTFPERNMQAVFKAIRGLEPSFAAPRILTEGEAGPEFRLLLGQVELIDAEFRSAWAGREYVLQNALNTLLIHLGRAVTSVDMSAVNVQSRKAIKVGRLLRLIESRFREHLPATAYARELGITSTHLNRLCREVLGRSTSELIHERLVMEAKRNLVYTVMTISEIARILGFADTAYFSRFFYRKTGVAPLKYRLAQQAGLSGTKAARAEQTPVRVHAGGRP